MPENHEILIEKAKKGDKNAFGEIYKIYLVRIYRFAYYLVSDNALAEDITQDTFVKAWKYLPKFSRRKGTIQAVLYRIARNLIFDNRRKKKEISLETPSLVPIEAYDNPENEYVDGENKDIVKKALSKLDGNDKEIVILRYFEELSFKDISDITKEKEGVLRVRLHRSLKKLKKFIESEVL